MRSNSSEASGYIEACIHNCAGLDGLELFQALAPKLCDLALARQWISGCAGKLANGSNELPVGYADAVLQSLVMADNGRLQLSLAIVSAEAWAARQKEQEQVIGFADGWTRICILHAGALEVQKFELQGHGQARHASTTPPVTMRTGDWLDLTNATESVLFTAMGQDTVMVRLLVRDDNATEAVECCALTGNVLRVRQAQSHEGRTRMVMTLLRALGRLDAVPVIADRLAEWPTHMRWHGVREALATDSLAGTALLNAMAESDPDDALRTLAGRTREALLSRYPQLAVAG